MTWCAALEIFYFASHFGQGRHKAFFTGGPAPEKKSDVPSYQMFKDLSNKSVSSADRLRLTVGCGYEFSVVCTPCTPLFQNVCTVITWKKKPRAFILEWGIHEVCNLYRLPVPYTGNRWHLERRATQVTCNTWQVARVTGYGHVKKCDVWHLTCDACNRWQAGLVTYVTTRVTRNMRCT